MLHQREPLKVGSRARWASEQVLCFSSEYSEDPRLLLRPGFLRYIGRSEIAGQSRFDAPLALALTSKCPPAVLIARHEFLVLRPRFNLHIAVLDRLPYTRCYHTKVEQGCEEELRRILRKHSPLIGSAGTSEQDPAVTTLALWGSRNNGPGSSNNRGARRIAAQPPKRLPIQARARREATHQPDPDD